MMDALGDKHSSYLDPNDFQQLNMQQDGSYEGIGAWVDTSGDYITIINPMEGSPAENAGVKPGDLIIAIDGLDLSDTDPSAALQMILGPSGTEVILTVEREGEEAPIDITITRSKITVPSVEYEMLDDDIADEIAYDNHDLDDGLKSGLLEESDLAGVPIWAEASRYVEKAFSGADKKILRYEIVRYLINRQVSDIIETTLNKLSSVDIRNPIDLDNIKEKLVVFSPEMAKKRIAFKKILFEKLYSHYRVVRMSRKASRFLSILFENYVNNPKQLPPQAFSRIEERGKYQVICDYLAGMTDRYALDQYKNLFEPYERV